MDTTSTAIETEAAATAGADRLTPQVPAVAGPVLTALRQARVWARTPLMVWRDAETGVDGNTTDEAG